MFRGLIEQAIESSVGWAVTQGRKPPAEPGLSFEVPEIGSKEIGSKNVAERRGRLCRGACCTAKRVACARWTEE